MLPLSPHYPIHHSYHRRTLPHHLWCPPLHELVGCPQGWLIVFLSRGGLPRPWPGSNSWSLCGLGCRICCSAGPLRCTSLWGETCCTGCSLTHRPCFLPGCIGRIRTSSFLQLPPPSSSFPSFWLPSPDIEVSRGHGPGLHRWCSITWFGGSFPSGMFSGSGCRPPCPRPSGWTRQNDVSENFGESRKSEQRLGKWVY